MRPSLGTFTDGGGVAIDLPRLLETRLLVQANSGGGKSWALRRILEQTAGQVQQLVIDPEGEFATLREKHDYVIAAAHDGDALAHPRTAQLLARRLLETGVSAILDIYDLKAHERQSFVRLFLDALTNAPKSLWQPCLVVLDEAHVFCPEAGKAESAGAVIDLATRGRKRGFALIAATQRLAKLHKDTAAELLNKLVGRTGLDVDVKRAADELGMTPKEAVAELRGLSAGDFFAFGPALSPTVRKLTVGPVRTTHPKAGDRVLKAPPKPTAAIVAVLPKLADLPKEAESEARTLEDLKRELATARRELTQARKGVAPAPDGASKAEMRAAQATVKRMHAVIEDLMKFVVQINAHDFAAKAGEGIDPTEIQKAIEAAVARATKLIETNMDVRNRELTSLKQQSERLIRRVRELLKDDQIEIAVDVKHQEPFKIESAPRALSPARKTGNGHAEPQGDLTGPEQRILDAVAWLEATTGLAECEQTAVAFLAGYTYGGGAFNNPRGRLNSRGLVVARGDHIQLTSEGRALANMPEVALTAEQLHQRVLDRLPGPEQRLLKPLLEAFPSTMSGEALAQAANYAYGAGAFNNPRGRLRSLGLIQYVGKEIVASKSLFPGAQ